ncbi:opsin 8, group member a [Paramisgurnus dabryanus]|uniref:opsin 8, group member a n=1 Tax=Paramisgurnus dabryanus TaxID=90735 RepID=UPI0031F3A50E
MDRYTSKLSPNVDYSAGVFLLLVAIFSILGNAAVLVTAARRHSVLKAPELLTVNLAVTDIGMALSMYPLSIASAFNHAWIGGDPSCLYYGLMGMIFSVASIMTLTVMGLVRYLVTGNPPKSGNRFQRRTISLVISVIWLYSLLWAVFPLLGWGGYGPEPYGLACSVDWTEYQRSLNGASFIMALAVLCTLIPCGFIVFSYFAIAWKLHKAYQSIQINESLPSTGTVERKVTIMGILISAGFIVSWAPYVSISLWTMFHSEGKDSVAPVVSLLPCLFAKCSTVYNPFVYYIFRRSFRRELRQIWTCYGCCSSSAVDRLTLCGGRRHSDKPGDLQQQERAEK